MGFHSLDIGASIFNLPDKTVVVELLLGLTLFLPFHVASVAASL